MTGRLLVRFPLSPQCIVLLCPWTRHFPLLASSVCGTGELWKSLWIKASVKWWNVHFKVIFPEHSFSWTLRVLVCKSDWLLPVYAEIAPPPFSPRWMLLAVDCRTRPVTGEGLNLSWEKVEAGLVLSELPLEFFFQPLDCVTWTEQTTNMAAVSFTHFINVKSMTEIKKRSCFWFLSTHLSHTECFIINIMKLD